MFIHLGENCMIKKKDIVGIFDIENTSVSAITKKFLNIAGKSGRAVYVSTELPRSFVVTEEKSGERYIYITALSSSTLTKRFNEDII